MQSHTHTHPKLSQWLNEAKQMSGYSGVGSVAPEDELTEDEAKQYREKKDVSVLKHWQFRIAILPTKDNLNKAMQAITQLFDQKKYDFVFKVLSLNDKECNWDGTRFDPKKAILKNDREQRGKEICVHMRFNPKTQSFECTPLQWKTVMLECWQALVAHQVEGIGYTYTPSGDKAVMAESGYLTPFSYASFKPETGRHGILYQTNYNPNTQRDPLARIVISKEDLSKYELVKQAEDMHSFRSATIRQHSEDATQLLTAQFKAINDAKAYPSLDTLLKRLKDEVYKGKVVHPNTFEKIIDVIEELIPRIERTQLISRWGRQLNDLLDKLKKNQFDAETRAILKNVISEIAKFKNEHLAHCIHDIQKDFKDIQPKLYDLTQGLNVDILIIKSPVKMQYLYRQCMHYLREKEAYVMFYQAKETRDAKEQEGTLEHRIKRANISVAKSACLYKIIENIPDIEQWHRFQQHTELLKRQLEVCKKHGLFHSEETANLLKLYSLYEKIIEVVQESSLEERAKAAKCK